MVAKLKGPHGEDIQQIKPKTPEMEVLLAAGYGMDKKKAELIVKERKENPHVWPYEEYEKAVAFLAAYNGTSE